MANFTSVAAAGKSIERLLNACFTDDDPIPDSSSTVRAVLVRTEDFDTSVSTTAIQTPALSIFPYRVEFNRTMRAAWSAVGSLDGRAHLPLDLHFMITPWADNAEYELRILGRAMQCLEDTPNLSGPLLVAGADWAPNEAVQVVLDDLGMDAVVRMFDSLPHDYKLSVSYMARVVRLDGRQAVPSPDVTTRVAGLRASGVP